MIKRANLLFQKGLWLTVGDNCELVDCEESIKYFKLAEIEGSKEAEIFLNVYNNNPNASPSLIFLNCNFMNPRDYESLSLIYSSGCQKNDISLIIQAATNGYMRAVEHLVIYYEDDDEKKMYWVVRLHLNYAPDIATELRTIIGLKNYPILYDAGKHLKERDLYGECDEINDAICLYQDTNEKATKSIICFLCICKHYLKLIRDIALMIGKILWEDRRNFISS